ncbi:DUF1541 domain-containing protein [Ureibacillus sp. 179-F W5.1 NHS]|uniref:DUF1541 domain-containing protein n=1 Tax=Lysinibacillus halotolerans TaxID=1368476 RepID=A0A3M8HFG5_9BACI|nr:YdhK family protein [Lysinibacillus halotolerans]RND01099.1 DUF1541 domain-containing protein [Lysinibacillus halotolerans]
MGHKLLTSIMTIVAALSLAACGVNDTNNGDTTETGTNVTNNQEGMDKQPEADGGHGEHTEHNGQVPEGLKEAENPKYPVGSTAIVNASHTDGMEGAVATIKAAYDTTVYSVSYTPTNGDPYEENHKWFVEGELDPVDEGTLDQGADVIINADHLEGMLGAQGVIDTVEETTVYVVDYTNSLGETVTDHYWLKESELAPEQ